MHAFPSFSLLYLHGAIPSGQFALSEAVAALDQFFQSPDEPSGWCVTHNIKLRAMFIPIDADALSLFG